MDYSRQELVIGKKNQDKLKKAKIAIVGIGALGTVAAELLARSGMGNLVLIDRDIVEESNLQRQTLFNISDIDKFKALIAKERIREINKNIKIDAYAEDLDYDNIGLIKADLVLDCTDNLETRFLINEYCIKNKMPWIYSSAIQERGFVFNIIPGEICFRCVFKESSGLDTCDTVGVLNSITNLIASVQVNEALKILMGNEYEKDMLFFDLGRNIFTKLKVKKNDKCLTCNGKYEYLTGDKKKIIKFCGTNTYQIKEKFDFENAKKRLGINGNYGFYKGMIITKNRVLVKASSEEEAKKVYSKYIGD